jgi:hypothetical protein
VTVCALATLQTNTSSNDAKKIRMKYRALRLVGRFTKDLLDTCRPAVLGGTLPRAYLKKPPRQVQVVAMISRRLDTQSV